MTKATTTVRLALVPEHQPPHTRPAAKPAPSVELPVSEARWMIALRAEAVRLARTMPERLRRAACDLADLVQEGAIGYLRALERATAAVRSRHAFAMAAARGAMLDALRGGEPPEPHVSLDVLPSALEPAAAEGEAWHQRMPRTPGDATGLAALPRRVRRAIAELSAVQQETLRLTLLGRGPREIAQSLGVSDNTVSLRKHRALAALRQRLAPEGALPAAA